MMTPFIMRALGNRMYGSWILITACVSYTALMDMGLSTGVARYISRAAGQGNDDEINRVINTSLRLFSLIGLAVLIFTFIGAGLCFIAVNDVGEAQALAWTALFLGTRMALKFPTRTFDGVLTSHLRYDLQVTATLTGFLLSYALIFYFLRHEGGVVAMSLAMLGCSLVEYGMIIVFARRVYPQLRLAAGLVQSGMKKTLFSYSWKTVVWQAANTLRFKADVPVIASMLGRSVIAPYSIGAQLNIYFYEFVATFIGNLSPVFSRYEGKGDYESIRERFLMMTRISSVISIFVGTSIMFYSQSFILRWMGKDFAGQLSGQASSVVATILAVGYIMRLCQTPSSSILYGVSKHLSGALSDLCEGVLNLLLSIILIRSWGIYGVAWGTTIASVVNHLLLYPFVTCRAIGLPVGRFYKNLSWTAFKTILPLVVFFYIARVYLRPDYGRLVMLGCIQTILFIPIGLFFAVAPPERKIFIKQIQRYFGRRFGLPNR